MTEKEIKEIALELFECFFPGSSVRKDVYVQLGGLLPIPSTDALLILKDVVEKFSQDIPELQERGEWDKHKEGIRDLVYIITSNLF